MWLFTKRPPSDPVLFVFGKSPKFGDFVEHNLSYAPWLKLVLDDLALKGYRNHPEPWFDLDNIPRAAMLVKQGFLGNCQWVRFWMEPSADSHGRRFPLVAGWIGFGAGPIDLLPKGSSEGADVLEDVRMRFDLWNVNLPETLASRLLDLRSGTQSSDGGPIIQMDLAPRLSGHYQSHRDISSP